MLTKFAEHLERLMVNEYEHKVRAAKAQADLAELQLKVAQEQARKIRNGETLLS